MGGSLARALKQKNFEVAYHDPFLSAEDKKLAGDLGLSEQSFASLGNKTFEGIILAAPVGENQKLLPDVKGLEVEFVTDIGSVKSLITAEAERLGMKNFLGSHPLVGSEKGGFSSSRENLYLDCVVFVTGHESAETGAVDRFWGELGARTVPVRPKDHDAWMAGTSHLPHLLSSITAGFFRPEPGQNSDESRVGSGFLDMTRMAMGPPSVWAPILTFNKSYLIPRLDDVAKTILELKTVLDSEKKSRLVQFLWGSAIRAALARGQGEPLIVAIDGPAGAGKSTVARMLGKVLEIVYLDTGAMYRAITYKIVKDEKEGELDSIDWAEYLKDVRIEFKAGGEEGRLFLSGEDVTSSLRIPRVNGLVSRIAAKNEVRQFLVSIQREYGQKRAVVMDGRDIGTVVFPGARVKFFVDANLAERAIRRIHDKKEVIGKTQSQVESEINARDEMDSKRSASPLKQAKDAIYVDTTGLDTEKVLEIMLSKIFANLQGR